MEGYPKEDIGGLDEKVVKIPLADEAADPIDPTKKKLRQNIDDVERQKEERGFRQRVSGQGIRVFENREKEKEKKADPDQLPQKIPQRGNEALRLHHETDNGQARPDPHVSFHEPAEL